MGRQDLAVELFYGGAWQPAPAYVRDPVTITRGYRDEGADIGQCTVDLTLDNRSTDYNPRNASSPLFGLAGRNTPVRGGLGLAVESFGGSSASGWTPTDDGLPWAHSGAALADFTESAGLGRHLQPLKNIIRVSRIGADRRDVEQVTDAAIPAVAVGASAVVGHFGRYQFATGDRYWLRMEFDVGGALTAKISRLTGGIYTDLAVRSGIPGLTYTAGQWWTFRSSVSGRRLAIKFWPTGTPEPTAWTLTATDSAGEAITAAGQYGLQSWVVAGNTNTTEVRFDNYRAVDRRFYCEISSWKPQRTVDFDPVAGRGDAWTEVEAAGVLRRLGQGSDVVNSPLYREILAAAPTAYWPLEDVDGADTAQSAVPGVADMAPFGYSRFTSPGTGTPVPAAGLPKFGTGGGIPGSKPVLDLSQGGVLAGSVPPASSSGWRIEWVMVAPRDKAAARIPIRWTTTGTWSTWDFQIESTGIFATFSTSPTSGASGSASRSFGIFDGRPHHYAVEAGILSGAMFANIYIDGDLVALYSPFVAGAFTGANPGSITSVVVNPLEEVNGTESMPMIGHVAAWNPAPVTDPDSTAAMLGWPGETAADRFLRLCAEEGVAAVVAGDPAGTRPMGAQRVAAFGDQLVEIARTDDALVYEPRDFLGLVMRTGRDLQNQAVALEVDYAAGEVHPPFAPVLDDQRTRNDVTATSTSTGASARSVLETGRMSVQPPPAGVGRYSTKLDVNPADPTDLSHLASWARGVHTVDEPRFPRLTVNLVDSPALIPDATAVDVGDLAAVVNLPNDVTPDDASLLALGYTETIGSHTRTITFNGTPGSPYTVATAGGDPRIPARGSTVAGPLTDSAMALSMASTVENGGWTTNPAYFPQDLRVGGEKVTASAIGAQLADTFSRTTSNGWGTADTGQAWTVEGAAAGQFSVSSSAGRHAVAALHPTVYRSRMAGLSIQDLGLVIGAVLFPISPTGAHVRSEVLLRWVDASNYVSVRVIVNVGNAVDLQIVRVAGGVETTLASAGTGVTHSAGVSLHVRVQAMGAAVQASVWKDGTAEPGWQATGTDPAPQSGDVGLMTLFAPGNTNVLPVTVVYDDVTSLNQTVTLSARGVNGVQRAWPAGTEVDVWTPAIAPL